MFNDITIKFYVQNLYSSVSKNFFISRYFFGGMVGIRSILDTTLLTLFDS